MAQLIVRNIDPEIVRRLKIHAARNGRSMEAEVREVLKKALAPRRPALKELLLEMPDVGRSSDFARRREKARRVEL